MESHENLRGIRHLQSCARPFIAARLDHHRAECFGMLARNFGKLENMSAYCLKASTTVDRFSLQGKHRIKCPTNRASHLPNPVVQAQQLSHPTLAQIVEILQL